MFIYAQFIVIHKYGTPNTLHSKSSQQLYLIVQFYT